jgi:hypothetical protein
MSTLEKLMSGGVDAACLRDAVFWRILKTNIFKLKDFKTNEWWWVFL